MSTRHGIRRLIWVIGGIAVVVLLALPWWIVFYTLTVSWSWTDKASAASVFIVQIFGGVWAVLNTRRGIPWLIWVIGGIIAIVLLNLWFWWLFPAAVLMGALALGGASLSAFRWILIEVSAIIVVLVFGGVWAVYGLVLFVLFVIRKFQQKE